CVAFRHVSRALLVTDQNVLDFGIEQRIVGWQNRTTWIAENHIDSFCDQAFNNDLRSGESFHLWNRMAVLECEPTTVHYAPTSAQLVLAFGLRGPFKAAKSRLVVAFSSARVGQDPRRGAVRASPRVDFLSMKAIGQ